MKKLTAALCAVLLVFCMFVPGAAAAGPALGATDGAVSRLMLAETAVISLVPMATTGMPSL